MDWSKLPENKIIENTILALKENRIEASLVQNKDEAKKKVLEMIPEGSEVMTMSSKTLIEIGILETIDESGKYESLKKKLSSMDRKTQGSEMNKLAAAPDFTLGSVHAVTEDGKLLIASNTGSQLPAYAYTSGKVIWVVGAQKIVKDLDMGMKRLYEYNLPRESVRMQGLYGMDSFISKILMINKEMVPGRLNLIFVNEVLGV